MRSLPLVLAAIVGAPGWLAVPASGAVEPLASSSQLALGVGPLPATLAQGLLGSTTLSAGGAVAATTLAASMQGNVLVVQSSAREPQLVLLRAASIQGEQHLRRGALSLAGVQQLSAGAGAATHTPTPVLLPASATLLVDSTLTVQPLHDVTLHLWVEVRHAEGGPVATERWTLTVGSGRGAAT